MAEPPISLETLTFGMLACLSDQHVHAVYDPADQYPLTACGWHVLPDIYLPGDVLFCRRCLAALPDDAELRPAANERRRSARPRHTGGFLAAFERWRLARKYDRRIHRAVVKEWHRG